MRSHLVTLLAAGALLCSALPATAAAPAAAQKVSMAALALYLASRDVGSQSACLTVFCTE